MYTSPLDSQFSSGIFERKPGASATPKISPTSGTGVEHATLESQSTAKTISQETKSTEVLPVINPVGQDAVSIDPFQTELEEICLSVKEILNRLENLKKMRSEHCMGSTNGTSTILSASTYMLTSSGSSISAADHSTKGSPLKESDMQPNVTKIDNSSPEAEATSPSHGELSKEKIP